MNKKRPKIGLALGSGGAKGLAQIGIIKVLQKNNIPIDYIAGTSVGSIVGAYYSMHGNIDGLEEAIRKLSKKEMLKLIDFISFKKGLVGGEKGMNFLIDLIGDKKFSDLKIPLKIIATDMEKGEEVWFDKGRLKDAIRASISIPGVFLPVRINGKFYLDGGLVNPTPVDVVKSMGADIIIAVDHTISNYSKVRNPSMIDTLTRSFEIIRTQTTKLKMGNINKSIILIQNENGSSLVETYNFYHKQFIDDGEKIAKKHLKKIKTTIKNWKK
jgi:NTE family protein